MPTENIDQSETYVITGEQIATIFAALADIDKVRDRLAKETPATGDTVSALRRAADGVYETLNGLPRSPRA